MIGDRLRCWTNVDSWEGSATMGGVTTLNITTEQLEAEFVLTFGDGSHVPDKLWVEHFHNEATYIRAVYSREFSGGAVDRLQYLRRRLIKLYGTDADVCVVVHLEDEDWSFFAAHRLAIHLAR